MAAQSVEAAASFCAARLKDAKVNMMFEAHAELVASPVRGSGDWSSARGGQFVTALTMLSDAAVMAATVLNKSAEQPPPSLMVQPLRRLLWFR